MASARKTDKPKADTPAGSDDGETGLGGSGATIGVLIKAFRVLEALAEAGGPLPLKTLAQQTDMPKGTVYRLLQTLHLLGYVSQIESSSQYYLTTQIAYLGRNTRQEDLKVLMLPHMEALHAHFNETVNLGVLEGSFVYYVAVLEANRALSWKVPAGTRDNFHTTAMGRAIAAFLPETHRAALLRQHDLRHRGKRDGLGSGELETMLDGIRDTGIALDREENDAGVVCIGTPVFLDGRVVAAVSISVPSIRFTDALGQEISHRLKGLDLNFRTNRKVASPKAQESGA